MASSRNSKFPLKKKLLLEHLLWVRHCPKCWRSSSDYSQGRGQGVRGVGELYFHDQESSMGWNVSRNLESLRGNQDHVSPIDFWEKTVAGRGNGKLKCPEARVGSQSGWYETAPRGTRSRRPTQGRKDWGSRSLGPRRTTMEMWTFTLSETGIHWRVPSICFSSLWRIFFFSFCLTMKKIGMFLFLGLPLATTLVPLGWKNKTVLLCLLHWVSLQVIEKFGLKTCISQMLPIPGGTMWSLPATKRGKSLPLK